MTAAHSRQPREAATPRLDPVALPLIGSRLIEASAGTGKTFTIALLYVRLVLGQRDDHDTINFPRALTPPEILVVTFTNAATQELRERIRARLVQAAAAFSAEMPRAEADDNAPMGDLFAQPAVDNTASEAATPGGDPLIALRDSYPRDSWPACARRLQLAAEWMDEAAVSTIHAWCYRMLREHAFDSGSLFALELTLDQSEMELEIARDYWRTFYYDLDPEALAIVAGYWQTPDALHNSAARLHGHAATLPTARPPQEALAHYRQQHASALAELKAPWPAWLDELEATLEDAAQRKAFNAQKLNVKSRANWIGALRQWAGDPEQTTPDLTETAWQRLTPDGLAEIWKSGPAPELPALAALAELRARLAELPAPYAELLAHAVQWMAARRHSVQRRRAELGPDDLLQRLDTAFEGEAGETLARRIREQFPVALVDEFQDTDPLQYRLFDRVYRLAENRDDSAVLLIGDPKQAIYAFRGADIHTYLQARHDTTGRHVTLGTNFRSAAPMVAAVNRLFTHAETRHDAGAFLFRRGDDNPVPFNPVDARGTSDVFTRRGAPQPALTLWHHAGVTPLSKNAYLSELAERCATEMATLLREGQAGRTGFAPANDDAPDTLRALAPSDLAVLVNNAGEARAIRTALLERGIRSVYLSDQEDVFDTEAALELEIWLAACAAPDDERALNAALATPSLGLSLAELDVLGGGDDQQDELAREARVMQFRDYHRQWRQRGVLPMLHRLLADFAVPGRLLAVAEGERRLTDLLHLGELLQEASAEIDGEHALLRFLAESRARPQTPSDAHRLRLESDAELVQVVTIHKAKGLEYPLVFLPFIATFRAVKESDVPLRWHDAAGHLQLTLRADETSLAHADHERLGEDLRKLYVALTRARHATWLGLAPLKEIERSAIGHLLGGGAPLPPERLRPTLEALASGNDAADNAVAVIDAPTPDPQPVRLDADAPPPGEARSPGRRIREHWWIASYSALHSGATPQEERDDARADAEPTTADEANAREVLDEPVTDAPRDSGTAAGEGALHRFPRGPAAGTFLHGLLEWAGREGFARVAADAEQRDDGLARRANRRGWEGQIPALSAWLPALLATPLPVPESPTPLRLDALQSYRIELEFWFAAHRVDTRRLDELISAHTLDRRPRPALQPDTLNGMLKGFIDLVAAHEGRFHVIDWKSNHLGMSDAAYSEAAMQDAVLEKRYDVQYCLYLLALHRLLKTRLPDYHIDRQLGGALYVFLRGSQAPSRGVHAERPPSALILALDALFRDAEETAA
ncbi:exodeoxyribonuclease V subunit beta [Kushneria aurantia]|uniref:RecBCD enzyme subunit RecB n=1 Tax=Kushneria aurantia TaxID=504092 RepID=A0ABV6G5Z5_9GAMM|nr:exodeoxyribonuclease V subunit beta [Kushneria aurantia]